MAFDKTDKAEGAKSKKTGRYAQKKKSLRILRRQEWRN